MRKPKIGMTYDYPGDPSDCISPSRIKAGRYVFNGWIEECALLIETEYYTPNTHTGHGSVLHPDNVKLLVKIDGLNRLSARDRYSYWIDRRVGDYIYRFADYEIKRCKADDAAKHFRTWKDYGDDIGECKRAWHKLCDQSAKFVAFNAFKEGALARKNGVVVGDNPYDEKADEFWEWMRGWLDGSKPTSQKEKTNASI